MDDFAPHGMGPVQLKPERNRNAEDQQDDQGLDHAELVLLDEQHDENVERCQADTDGNGQAEEQMQRDG
jgi:hypothetical protein